jgi:uncharacterized protein YjiS (DUF1127 family)
MLRSLQATPGQAAGTLAPSLRYARHIERPGSFLEALVARLLGADAPAIIQLPLEWIRRSRYRQELANLRETQLRDVGLDPNSVQRESAKPFWMA